MLLSDHLHNMAHVEMCRWTVFVALCFSDSVGKKCSVTTLRTRHVEWPETCQRFSCGN